MRLVERFHYAQALTIVPEALVGHAGFRVAFVPDRDVPGREACHDVWLSFNEDTGLIESSCNAQCEPMTPEEMLEDEVMLGLTIDGWPIDREFLATWQHAPRDRALYFHAVRQLAALASVSEAPLLAVTIPEHLAVASELQPLREGPRARFGWSVGDVVITDTAMARVEGAGEVDIVGRWLEGDDEAAITRRIRKLAERAEKEGLRGEVEPVARFAGHTGDIVPDPVEEGMFWLSRESGWFRWRLGERGDGTPVPRLAGACGGCARIEDAWWLITSGGSMLRLPWDGQYPSPCMTFNAKERLVVDPDGKFVMDDDGVRLPMPTRVAQWARGSEVALSVEGTPGSTNWPLVCGGGRWFASVNGGATTPVIRRGASVLDAPTYIELPTCGHPQHATGHPARQWLAFASRAVVVLDLALRRVVVAFDGRMGHRSVVFSPDGRWMLFATGEGLGLWKVGTGSARFVGRFEPTSIHRRVTCFTASGKHVVFGGALFDWSALIGRWDVGTVLMPLAMPTAALSVTMK